MSDKYPESSGRRRFVKGVVGSAGVAGIGTAGVASLDTVTNQTGTGGGQTTYFGVQNTGGPAPRAMPMVPIEIDDEGYLRGVYPEIQEVEQQGETVQVARQDLGGITYEVDWFQYCGIQDYQGLQPSYEGDNYFRYSGGSSAYEWQPGSGQVHVDDFEDYETWDNQYGEAGIGKPASVTWRSQETDNSIPVQVIRSTLLEDAVEQASGQVGEWLDAATQDGFMAFLNKCTHYCCVPGYRSSNYEGAGDKIYCACHQSIYDPYSIVKRSFTAYPRPEDG
ncbi:Rieske 2Fe-2S domain-containing protein [Halobacterium noricense]|nr:Rieske 2Fe-2S domain-containing protein [Halobacterium noricense]UHH26035.1 Rieske 2Fe-2S domain-containing protein [Halobacterium noricense]